MPYGTLHPKDQLSVRASSALVYLMVVLGGLSALLSPPNTIIGRLGGFTYVWGAGAVVFGTVAALSALRGSWRLEWVAAWFCAAPLALYTMTVAVLVLDGQTTRLAQATTLLGLIFALVNKALYLGGHARVIREQHRAGGAKG